MDSRDYRIPRQASTARLALAIVVPRNRSSLEAQAAASQDAQDAMTRTMHGMGAELATPAEQQLNLERTRVYRDLQRLREV